MAIKLSLAILLIVGGAVLFVWSKQPSQQLMPKLQLTASGNEELGIEIQLPYGEASPADVVITNNGKHHLIAYRIRWEGIKYTGEVVERQSTKYHPEALIEKNAEKRLTILQSNPLLAPGTKWFVGLGRDNKPLSGKIPSLDEVGKDPYLFPDLGEYKVINVTLDAAILDDGRVIGQDPVGFQNEIDSIVSEHFTIPKEMKNDPQKD